MPDQNYGWPTQEPVQSAHILQSKPPEGSRFHQELSTVIDSGKSIVLSSTGNDKTFTMDERAKNLLTDIPEMYHNFLINYGIKLVAETELYEFYLNPRITIAENTGNDSENKSLVTKPQKKETKKEEPKAQSAGVQAAAGFSSW